MLAQLSWKEFLAWQDFDEIEPFTSIRDDMRFASVVAMMVNLRRNTEKHPKPFPVSDFLLLFGDKEERERLAKLYGHDKPKGKSWQELKAMGQFLAGLFNAVEESDKEKRNRRKRR